MKIRRFVCLLAALTMVLSMTTVTADAATFQSKPTDVKAKCVSGVAVKVSCEAKKGATGYKFYYAVKRDGEYTLGATSDSCSATIEGLTTGKNYFFKVRAYKGTKTKIHSKMSEAVKCKTVLRKPTVKVTDKCDCKVYLKLSCQKGTKKFAVYRSTKKNKGFKRVGTVISGAVAEWNDEGLKASTTYYYKAKAISGKYSTKCSSVVAVKTHTRHRNGNDAAYNPSKSLAKGYKLIGKGKNSLTGRNILFLGSSITYGSATKGVSFADYIRTRNNANVKKLAVSGTTMAKPSLSKSYVSRLKNWDAGSYSPDIFVCQLSLNDSLAKNKVPLGTLPNINFSTLTDSDLQALYKKSTTVGGAIGFITAYAHKKWPYSKIVFFTVRNNGYNNKYAKMRKLLFDARDKYGNIKIIDMWSMKGLTNLKGKKLCMYMKDANHPKKAGYLYQWTLTFESKLNKWMPPLFTVTWRNGDKVEEKDKDLRRGTALSYDGADPVKAGYEDEEFTYTYTFKGWRNEASGEGGRVYTAEQIKELTVTGNMTFVAVFEENQTPKEQENPGIDGGEGTDQTDPNQGGQTTEGGDGSGEPNDGSGTSDDGTGTPNDGSGAPDDGSGNPDGGSADPDEESVDGQDDPDTTGQILIIRGSAVRFV